MKQLAARSRLAFPAKRLALTGIDYPARDLLGN